ncbi:MAG: integrase/recombinase XerD [Acidimicrobiaceae bacterium]|jgi:site-specific recombinase XerC
MATLTPYIMRYVGGRQRRGEITHDTARSIRNHLWHLDDVVGNRPLDQLGRWVIDRWLEKNTHLRASTRGKELCSIRGFAAWMVDNDIIVKDFTRGAAKIRRPRKEPRDIRLEHFVACLEVCRTTREQVIVWLAYGLGLRAVEISRLTVDSWDTTTHDMRVIGKALHERTIPVPTVARGLFASYLRERGASSGPFVHNELSPGAGVTPSTVSNLFTRIIARTGMKGRPWDGFSGHGLRAGGASDLLDAAGDLRVVQEFLGHANLATTSIYMRRTQHSAMRAALEQRHWTAQDLTAADHG